jgi:murein DD-endopeptidase MepM/ murein hydrolase activator NlpD
MKTMNAWLKKAFASVTIMVIPHNNPRSLNLRVPAIGIVVVMLMAVIGGGYTLCLAISGLKYKAKHHAMVEKMDYYSGQFHQWASTMMALKTVEGEFRQLFSSKSKEEVLENANTSFAGSLEIPELVAELKKTIESVDEIKDYLRVQKDIYLATPQGYPVIGKITSNFGKRSDPISGEMAFHSGIDISCNVGSPIHATADGVVSHSGWVQGSGFVVVIEHGCGLSTVYAHNKTNNVKVGQKIKRKDIIGYVGSTGKSTGPHLHYEVWKNGKSIDAQKYLPNLRRA